MPATAEKMPSSIRFLEDCVAPDTQQLFKKDTAVPIEDDDDWIAMSAYVESGKAVPFDITTGLDVGSKSRTVFVVNRTTSADDSDDEVDALQAAQKILKLNRAAMQKAAAAAVDEQMTIKGKVPENPHIEITGRRGSEKEGHETFGFESMSAFKRMLYHYYAPNPCMTDDEVKQVAAMIEFHKVPSGGSEAIDPDGGFLIPPEHRTTILQKIHEGGQILSRCNRMSTGSNTLSMPFIHETSRADGSRWGGVQAFRRTEAAQYTNSKPALGRFSVTLEKLTALYTATDELMEDSSLDLGSLTTPMFIDELTFKVEQEIIEGLGGGEIIGLLNADATVEQAKNTGQTALTIDWDNIVKMWARMWARSRANSVWLVNNDTLPQLFTMTQTMNIPVMPAGELAGNAGVPPLIGRPVIAVEHCKTLGTVGDIILADMSQFVIVEKSTGPMAAASIHLRFNFGEQVFRWTWRINGAPWWQDKLTPKNGTATQSPWVTLGTRA